MLDYSLFSRERMMFSRQLRLEEQSDPFSIRTFEKVQNLKLSSKLRSSARGLVSHSSAC